MLVSKKANLNGKVIAAKLISGEEIMAKLISLDDGIALLNKPVSYVMNMNPDNPEQGEVMFAPWMLGIDMSNSIEIDVKHILYIGAASLDASTKYIEAIGESSTKVEISTNIRENITTTANIGRSVPNPQVMASHRR